MAWENVHERRDYLRRLPPEHYRGRAIVHWSMAMEDRETGWLVPIFYYKFRELLTHTMFRYGLCCPIYCCMPDHLHLLWVGILDGSDQRNAVKFFRAQLNPVLGKLGPRLSNNRTITCSAKKSGSGQPSRTSSSTSLAIRNVLVWC